MVKEGCKMVLNCRRTERYGDLMTFFWLLKVALPRAASGPLFQPRDKDKCTPGSTCEAYGHCRSYSMVVEIDVVGYS